MGAQCACESFSVVGSQPKADSQPYTIGDLQFAHPSPPRPTVATALFLQPSAFSRQLNMSL